MNLTYCGHKGDGPLSSWGSGQERGWRMVAGEDSRATLEPQMFDEVSSTPVRQGKQPPQALRRTCSAGTENSAPPSPAFVRGSAFRTPGGNTLGSPRKRTWGVGSLPARRAGSPTLFSAGESAAPCYSWQGERLRCPFTVFAGLGWGELFRVFCLEVFCLAGPPRPPSLGWRESRLCWGSVSVPRVISGWQASLTLSLGYTR